MKREGKKQMCQQQEETDRRMINEVTYNQIKANVRRKEKKAHCCTYRRFINIVRIAVDVYVFMIYVNIHYRMILSVY